MSVNCKCKKDFLCECCKERQEPSTEETGWQGTTGFHDNEELGDDWT